MPYGHLSSFCEIFTPALPNSLLILPLWSPVRVSLGLKSKQNKGLDQVRNPVPNLSNHTFLFFIDGKLNGKNMKREAQVTKISIIIVAAFAILYLPNFMIEILDPNWTLPGLHVAGYIRWH